jgi:hypothetical protein
MIKSFISNYGKMIGLFIAGWAGIAATSQNPSAFQWDWLCLQAAILSAGLSQTLVAGDVSTAIQILATIGSFFLGWGTAESSIGYRYVLWHFDFRALLAGLASIGLVNSSNLSVTNPIRSAIGVKQI